MRLALLFALGGCGEPQDADPATPEARAAQTLEPPEEPLWPPGECDDVYEMRAHAASPNSAATLAANMELHPQFSVAAPWGDARAQAIAFAPLIDNRSVLADMTLWAGLEMLAHWAPGDRVSPPLPADVGIELPQAGKGLRLDMHYYNVGNPAQRDRSGFAVCVVRDAHLRPKLATMTSSFTSFGPILAPANDRNHESTGTCTVNTTVPVTLLQAHPFARKLAKSTRLKVRREDRTEVVFFDQPFKFGEQRTYPLEPPMVVQKGDVVYTTCTYDNPTSKNVTFGESLNNEACFNFVLYYPKGALRCGLGLASPPPPTPHPAAFQ